MRHLSNIILLILLLHALIVPYKVHADCSKKGAGDANCDGKIDLQDFEIWRREFTAGCRIDLLSACGTDDNNDGNVMDADFNDAPEPQLENKKGISLIDFEYWRRSYTAPNVSITPTPTINPSPTSFLPTNTPTIYPSVSCLNLANPHTTLNGKQSVRYDTRNSPLPSNYQIAAGSAIWEAVNNFPVDIAGGSHICFSGGLIQGRYPPDTAWDIMHSTSAMYIMAPSITIENVHIDDYGDGIGFEADARDFTVRSVYISYSRDDCIENDWLHGGLVDDSLFDGCYSAFSARTSSSQTNVSNGSNNIWTIQNSLIRLQPMDKVYKDRGIIPGHDGFFKWDSAGISPQLSLHNNIFRVDQQSNNVGLGIPSGKLTSCSNNIMIWLGQGAYPGTLPTTLNGKPCFSISTDKTIWDNAVSVWKKKHGY